MSKALEISHIEMARQTSGYLVAVAGSVLAIFGIMAAVPNRSPMPSFGMRAFALVLCSMAGAHYMSQVVAYDPGNKVLTLLHQGVLADQVQRSFMIASITVYASLIGFLEVLLLFTRTASSKNERIINGYLKASHGTVLLLLASYIVYGELNAFEIVKCYPNYGAHALIGAIIGLVGGSVLGKLKRFAPAGPVPASAIVQATASLFGGFLMVHAIHTEGQIEPLEVVGKNALIAATIAASALGLLFTKDFPTRCSPVRKAHSRRPTVHFTKSNLVKYLRVRPARGKGLKRRRN